jgi:hypothetical protein
MLRLLNMQKRLYGHCFKLIFLTIAIIELGNLLIKLWGHRSLQQKLFIQFFVSSNVVLFIVVEFHIHINVQEFLHLDRICPLIGFCYPVILDS